MSARRYVYLDPDGMDGEWLHVIVEAPTGVVYQQQYGGTACRQGRLEGFLVPLTGADALDALRELFEEHFRGAGTRNHSWSAEEQERLRLIVEDVPYWFCDGRDEEPRTLSLDQGRMHGTDEAWIPVTTPDGPGVLVWLNSD
ncbi:DUF6210 family protein [Streptomyces alkaliterrae]|uniref:Uncharacterized protein n=1 Tax=Streptomyces alkaliterrae TaxID=2213162 RepID=A0A5P0YPC1_9ACTN|nr:DUF6210 family protein [Streptomyces alkaliterrae]MBB1254060.1 hypothetical protein [Streptomyces alkaliterrae]MBB1260702.1 hypothetical protein [Streptomyces alkaliterrae]MQS02166.1 hypothetical protein [Streptomyces alkaliterrae]